VLHQVHRSNQRSNMKKNQKEFTPVLIIAIIVIVAMAAYLLLNQKDNYTIPSSTYEYTTIQNSSDLDSAATDLDNTDTSEIDTDLDQLNSDASDF
jgi:hypothetical protein